MKATIRANTSFPTGNGTAGATLNKAEADAAVGKVQAAATGKAADVAGPIADWPSEQDSLKASQRKAAADADQGVSEHPWKSLGFAPAPGFLISRTVVNGQIVDFRMSVCQSDPVARKSQSPRAEANAPPHSVLKRRAK